ncbi:MAG: DUF1611 domain-containing protein [Pseudomonadota bacterium]
MLKIKTPYLLFAADETQYFLIKTGLGLAQWAADKCVGQLRLHPDALGFELNDYTIKEAVDAGAKSLVVGIAPVGGRIPDAWIPVFLEAIESGLDIVSGLHDKLNGIDALVSAATKCGTQLIDVRTPPEALPCGTGAPRSGKRVLTVGTDCAIGKKYTSLALAREFLNRGVDCDFRATGQTGIMISGSGIPIDAVISDFLSGAAETLSPAADENHWDIIEGQGSLFHPSFAAVTLGLIHGSQPDAMILCHQPTRRSIEGFNDYPLPTLPTAIETYVDAAKLTSKNTRVAGICLNTHDMSEDDALRAIDDIQQSLGLPCVDPIRTGVGPLADALLGAS